MQGARIIGNLIPMVGKSPKDRVVGPLPFMAELHGLKRGVIPTTYPNWDDPPSNPLSCRK